MVGGAVFDSMNFRFGMSLGAGVDGLIYGGASASADILKSLMPFVLAWGMARCRWALAVAASVLWLVFTGYSLTSSLGFSAKTRADTTAGRQVIAERYADSRAALKDIEAKLAGMPVTSLVPMLELELKALQRRDRWRATSACSDATIPASIRYCARYAKILAQVQSGRQRQAFESRRQELQQRLDVLADRGVVSQADPQIGFLVQLLPVNRAAVRTGLILMVALLVELGSGLGFYVLIGCRSTHGARTASPDTSYVSPTNEVTNNVQTISKGNTSLAVLPAPDEGEQQSSGESRNSLTCADWLAMRVVRRSSAHAPGTLLYEDFCAWVALNDTADMTFTEFCQW